MDAAVRQKLTAAQIADSLEISVRTVYRYIDALGASGVPVVAESGHDGGVYILDSFSETPLFFNALELKATSAAKRKRSGKKPAPLRLSALKGSLIR
ncbi:HTH domain-containing protein [Paenibacillus sp. FSL R7-0302]|uniref:helix-turn-helix transcriptional regulator n=1 Tax=Paenibacillus sp. FSL R7-0302 TaxID=2921681 RepID=UPI0030F908BD